MAVCHAIRNAQDATDADGHINVDLVAGPSRCAIHIRDSGRGMDADFIQDRLFRPFDSTKGAEGMGIGAYQIRETVRMCGGDVEVDSVSGEGTTFTLHLPLAAVGAS